MSQMNDTNNTNSVIHYFFSPFIFYTMDPGFEISGSNPMWQIPTRAHSNYALYVEVTMPNVLFSLDVLTINRREGEIKWQLPLTCHDNGPARTGNILVTKSCHCSYSADRCVDKCHCVCCFYAQQSSVIIVNQTAANGICIVYLNNDE